jgi:hypothetical protein
VANSTGVGKRNVWQYFLRVWLFQSDVEIPIWDYVVRDDCHDGVVAEFVAEKEKRNPRWEKRF